MRHLLGIFGKGSWGKEGEEEEAVVEQGGFLGELALIRQGRGPVVSYLKVAHIVVRVCGASDSGSRLRFGEGSWFLPDSLGASEPPFAHTSHVVGNSFAVLFSPTPTSEDKFRRDKRSVQARVSLCEVTPDKAARRQRAQASSAAFEMCVRSGTREERTSFRSRGRSMNWDTGLLRAGWRLGQHSEVLVESRGEQTGQIWEGAVVQPQVWDLAFQSISTCVLRPCFVVQF